MAKSAPLLLYSTNTRLAYNLNQHYYGGRHWVWCNPFFDVSAAQAAGYNAPPSSVPLEIYRAIKRAIAGGDNHSNEINGNRTGLLRGVDANVASKTINAATATVLRDIIRTAQLADFAPLIYVIPFAKVRQDAVQVAPAAAANPFSAEYQIFTLRRSCFDPISP